MKQHITQEQLNELSWKQKDKLEVWSNRNPITKKPVPKGYEWSVYASQIDIGFMIEFLDEKFRRDWTIHLGNEIFMLGKDTSGYDEYFRSKNLCDALWKAVKEELNKTE